MTQLAEREVQPASIGTTWLAERHFYFKWNISSDQVIMFIRLRSDEVCFYMICTLYDMYMQGDDLSRKMAYVQAKLQNMDYAFIEHSAYDSLPSSIVRCSSLEDFDMEVAEAMKKYHGYVRSGTKLDEMIDAYLKYADRDMRTTL